MSEVLINPYVFAVTSESWETSGYGSASPTISTVTNSNDTSAPSGSGSSSTWANGTAISLTDTNVIEVKTVGTVGEGGSIPNTVFGLTTLASAGATADVNMTSWNGGASTGTVAYARINEPGQILTYIEGGGYDESSTFTSGATYKIVIDGTDVEFFKNDVSIRTATVTSGTYYAFCTSYLGGLAGTFQLV